MIITISGDDNPPSLQVIQVKGVNHLPQQSLINPLEVSILEAPYRVRNPLHQLGLILVQLLGHHPLQLAEEHFDYL